MVPIVEWPPPWGCALAPAGAGGTAVDAVDAAVCAVPAMAAVEEELCAEGARA